MTFSEQLLTDNYNIEWAETAMLISKILCLNPENFLKCFYLKKFCGITLK